MELILVLGVGTMVSFMKFQDMRNNQENILASTVGQQMKQIGEAVNGYINIKYDKLSTLSNAAGTGTDPGPRTCSGSVCEINYQTLINEGLLPSTFIGVNANKSSYKILLRRGGISPNYVINGLITTTVPWSEGNKIRYDLLGKAMQTAGIDSGMTSSSATASGYGRQWKETSSNFNNITMAGQLTYRVGYNSALYSVFLRRDGTLPMTGELNMGGNNISNAKDITASGMISSGTLKSTGLTDIGGQLLVTGTSLLKGAVSTNGSLTVDGITTLKNSLTASGNITSSQKIQGVELASTGRTSVGEYLQINGTATENTVCAPNGLQGRDTKGMLLSCVNGKWQSGAANSLSMYALSDSSCISVNALTGSCSCQTGTKAISMVQIKGTPGVPAVPGTRRPDPESQRRHDACMHASGGQQASCPPVTYITTPGTPAIPGTPGYGIYACVKK
ncbi:hypothetical protein QMY51_03375 [Escherichia coli]|nr:shufflon system plasmid conjugative transfer pilus tip adhesin PilV [Escherichia coli]KDW01846.1 bacterial shufflon, N-terminal constant region family protein [Escherichia coli 2-156-04_S3_C1]WNT84535.1 hypothetical protein QMY51_03375 [Escherichia coli]GCS81927.1 pilus assembly protein PilV [Escherichia coli]